MAQVNTPHERTSLSLSPDIKQLLKQASLNTKISQSALALLCLRKLMKSKRLRFSERVTVQYNPMKSSAKLYLVISQEEQRLFRTIRLSHAVSISYLMCEAILLYLQSIINISLEHNYVRKILRPISIHFRVQFQHPNCTGFSTIIPYQNTFSKVEEKFLQ